MTKERKWILKDPADPEKVGRLSAELGIDRVLAELLVKRKASLSTGIMMWTERRPSLWYIHS